VAQASKPIHFLRTAAKAVAAIVFLYLIVVYGNFAFNGMSFDPHATAYVTFKPADTDRLLNDLTSISKLHGLDPWRGSATPDDGRTTYVFEATGRALRIWASNVVLSGEECPDFPGVGSDAGQFGIYVSPAIWLPLRDRATALSEQLSRDLASKGYHLSAQPSVPCDPTRQVPPNTSLERTRDK
jgi:hypothetical protein